MTRLAFAALIPVLLASTAAVAQDKTDMQDARNVELKGSDGASMGTASFVPTPHGVLIEADLQNLPGGTHGFHIHETGVCEGDFSSAGGHYNPGDVDHGYMGETGPHAGDMPNVVATDGAVKVSVFNPNVSMTGGDAPLDDEDGSALMIHSGADDYASQPAGDAGSRIACGVIFPAK
ncbi:superoxide dismutase family protein [Aurantimonas sp. 22II-16-19i]|uniref:superoxide dismutase family protein n=1 Tax=Aurantimonas sp. 22II-16-19i TaxID=1317114 RepID=UPI0009F7FEC5|nr:superoxide dismutase family protein [Aurantimonas sp. 22II-16-19i]ORE98739.1 superoxide dismutase, copper/zinc binding protein [Aurantimonas sp. 22II-16-19i]